MKKFIITEEELQKIANGLSQVPTSMGLPIIDILRALPVYKEVKEESEGK